MNIVNNYITVLYGNLKPKFGLAVPVGDSEKVNKPPPCSFW